MQDQQPPPFPKYLRAWLERQRKSVGDLAAELGTEPETVQRMLSGTPVASQFRVKIHAVTGYDFDQVELDAIRTACLATEQDPRVRELLELIQSWEDLLVLLRSVTNQISTDFVEQTCGTAKTTLRSFVCGDQRTLREATFTRVIRALPQLTDIAEGRVLSRISPVPVFLRALAQARLDRGLSKTDLAQELGFPRVTVVTRWEEKPDSIAHLKAATRDAIARFLKLSEAGVAVAASASSPRVPPQVPRDVEAGVTTVPHAPPEQQRVAPAASIQVTEHVDPQTFAALVRRVEAIDRKLTVHCNACAAGADRGETLEDADARVAQSNGVRHIFSAATYRPLPEDVQWTDADTAEAQRRIESTRYALKALTEIHAAPERQRIVQALANEIDELYRVVVALENLEPTAVFEMIDRERELSHARFGRR